MGWVAFRLKRTKKSTLEDMGEITMIFPKVSEVLSIPRDGKNITMAELIVNPDFPVETTVFSPALDDFAKKLKTYGFGNTINPAEYDGERWTMNNGNFIDIQVDQQYVAYFYYTRGSDNKVIYTMYTNIYPGISFTPAFPPVIVGDHNEGLVGNTYLKGSGDVYTLTWDSGRAKYGFPDSRTVVSFDFFAGAKPIVQSTDPYDGGGESTHGGGGGKFDDPSTPADIPSIPVLNATETGFVTLYNPTLSTLRDLASFLWSGPFDDASFKKLFANPMDAILGLSLVPVKPRVTIPQAVKFGNINTEIGAPIITHQFEEIDCGSLFIDEYWGAYLDYSPYTKIDIYLPYIGTHPLSADDIMNKTIRVVYHVDLLSGACVAFIKCDESVIYSFTGQCSMQIPINANNWNNAFNGAISVATSIGTMIASGGMTAPMGVAQIASTSVNAFKPDIEKSGSMCGSAGMLSVQTPYLIITRPRQAVPRLQNTYTGYPSFITENLADLNGYTEIENIHLENVPATAQELSEIESLLKSGVIF